jgi:hypothetical protein
VRGQYPALSNAVYEQAKSNQACNIFQFFVVFFSHSLGIVFFSSFFVCDIGDYVVISFMKSEVPLTE